MKKLIVFEGPDGCGKSTLARNIQKILPESVVYRRPSLHRKKIFNSDSEFEACFWLMKDFLETDYMLKQTLKTHHVLMDRYVYSAYVYQHVLAGLSAKTLKAFFEKNDLAKEDLLIVIDEDYEICKKRLEEKEKDRFEKEDVQRKVHAIYQSRQKIWDGAFVLDARGKNLQDKISVVRDLLEREGLHLKK